MLRELERKIQKWEYRSFSGETADLAALGIAAPAEAHPDTSARVRELEASLEVFAERAEKLSKQVEEARREGIEQGRAVEQSARTELLKQCAETIARGVEVFRADRDQYLGAVEHEVVRLALAIAARILHREAQMDPLLLSGAVRVALGQLGETAEVRLRVPAEEQDLWTEMLRLMPNLALRPELVPDDRMHAGEAALEAHSGSVDLGVRAQLDEIERGFFDLMESRETVRTAGSGKAPESLRESTGGSFAGKSESGSRESGNRK